MKLKTNSTKLIFIAIFLFSIFLFSTSVSAAGLIPCGTTANPTMCTVCDFFVLIQNIINLILLIFASLATLAAVYIAFLFMFSGGSPQRITDAKSKLWLLVWGIFWVLGSWLVLNTILNFIVDKSVFPWPWNKINCEVSRSSSAFSEDTGASNDKGASEFGGGESGGGGASGSWDDESMALERLDSGVYEDGIDTSADGYEQFDDEYGDEYYGLEQIEPGDPYSQDQIANPAVAPTVSQADTKGVDPNLVKAIIQAESSGNTNAIHVDKDGQASYGLMQVRPDTARRYDPELRGLSDAQIGEKLKNPDYNVKLGTAYLQDLSVKYGSNLNKVIAAYNGGPGANKPSVNCSGSSRWQCEWDNNAHTIPNKGYAVTRNYVMKVNNYYSQLR